MNINENIWIEQLEIIGDILEDIKELDEQDITQADIIREFNIDPKD